MFGSSRKKLVRQGLACTKVRRKPAHKEWMRRFEVSPWVKTAIFGAFVLGLAVLIFSGEHPDPAKYFLIGLLIFVTAVAQLWINHPETFEKNSRVGLVFGVILFHLVVAKLVTIVTGQDNGPIGVLLIPYALAPLVLSVLLGKTMESTQ